MVFSIRAGTGSGAAGPVHQEPRRDLLLQDRNVRDLPGPPVPALAGDQDPAVPGRGQEPAHRRLIGRVVQHQ